MKSSKKSSFASARPIWAKSPLKRMKKMMGRHKILGDVRGKGCLLALELVKDRETKEPFEEAGHMVYQKAFARGLAWVPSHHIMRLSPPLIMEDDMLLKGFDIIEDALTKPSSTSASAEERQKAALIPQKSPAIGRLSAHSEMTEPTGQQYLTTKKQKASHDFATGFLFVSLLTPTCSRLSIHPHPPPSCAR